jgi:hypothetical protein
MGCPQRTRALAGPWMELWTRLQIPAMEEPPAGHQRAGSRPPAASGRQLRLRVAAASAELGHGFEAQAEQAARGVGFRAAMGHG